MEYDKKQLEELILEQNKSYSEIGKLFNVSGNAIKKAAKKLGIKVPQRRRINPNENFSHSKRFQNSLVNRVDDETFIKIIESSTQWKEIGEKLGYKKNNNSLSSNVKDAICDRCSKLGIELKFDVHFDIKSLTKGELFGRRNGYQSARSAIRKDAQKTFLEENKEPCCKICGYNKHIEVAHIKAVSEFDDNTLISEINSIDNLIALCPNHHWEYDNGIIEL